MDKNHLQSGAASSRAHVLRLSSRREFLVGVGAGAAALSLQGCGGGGGANNGQGTTAANVDRTVVSGNLTHQINQFSQVSEQIGNIWEGHSPALVELKTFANGGNRAAGANSRVMVQAVWYSLMGLRSGYERLANGLLAEDDQSQVAAAVNANNQLSGNGGVTNPQWLAAMMLQTYCAFRVTGAFMKIIQIAGVQQMQDWVKSQTGSAEKLIAYGILADTFNSWLDAIQSAVGAPSLATMKLDVSGAVTPSNVARKVDTIPALLDSIPYGAGYRVGGAANGVPDDAMLTGTAASNFALSFLGALTKITLTSGSFPDTFPQTVSPTAAKYDFTARLGATGIGTQVTALAGSAAQTKTDTIVAQLFATALPAADGSLANCLVQVAGGAYGAIVAVAQAILSDHSLVGAAIAGDIALGFLNTEVNTIKGCGTVTQLKILASVACDIAYLQSTYLIGGNVVTLRTIPVANIPASVETDQIRDTLTLLCSNQLCYPLANAGWTAKPSDGLISLFRQVLAGLSRSTVAPRTFNNAEVSGAGLFYDLLFRNQALLKPDFLTNGQFIFCTSNFARLLRRSPGAISAQLPSITAAALLCSAPNFTPSRTGSPVDLSKIAALGPLTAATSLVPGVPIHVQ